MICGVLLILIADVAVVVAFAAMLRYQYKTYKAYTVLVEGEDRHLIEGWSGRHCVKILTTEYVHGSYPIRFPRSFDWRVFDWHLLPVSNQTVHFVVGETSTGWRIGVWIRCGRFWPGRSQPTFETRLVTATPPKSAGDWAKELA